VRAHSGRSRLPVSVGVVLMLSACSRARTAKEAEHNAAPTRPAPVTAAINPKHIAAYTTEDDPKIGVGTLGPRRWKIVDVHEHLESERQAERLLVAMDQLGVQRVCLMGSGKYTLTMNSADGFEGFKENNEAILTVKRKHPDRFCAFVTLDPLDNGNLSLLQDYVKRGADGLKLYLGHGSSTGKGPFHSMPLDDPRMEPIYAWAERVQLPIVLHVNLEKFGREMVSVLEKHPCLRVDLPHLGLEKTSTLRLMRMGFILDRYPNVFTDLSGGYTPFETAAFEVLAMNRAGAKAFFESHASKIMFGADMVLTHKKTMDYITSTLRSYSQFLESERWRYVEEPALPMYGLNLDAATLTKVYEEAPRRFLSLDTEGKLPDRTHDGTVAGARKASCPRLPPPNEEQLRPLFPRYRALLRFGIPAMAEPQKSWWSSPAE
jgi:predicted TIM-barrel fold metal-dependent hydrolase